MEEKYQTLGDNVFPVNYNLLFDTNMKTFKFTGTERIKVRIRKGTNSIKLNSVELKILEAKVRSSGKSQSAKVREDKRRNEITLSLQNKVSGDAVIEIKFIGENNDRMYGFYRSKYTDHGKERHLLTSQFEAADARAAFPCFDEPAFKATFDVSMAIDNTLEAVSNMPIRSAKAIGKGRKIVTFATTPRMSSYLLYLGVGKYDVIEGREGRIKLRIMCVPGKRRLAMLSLDYAKKFIRFFEDYFGIRYPLPKIDFLAIPDFSAGAMENWGAITFREVAILADEKRTPIAVKQQIAETVAHELAHQWFGDLVTMKWWNDLWLNESFATFMANKALDHAFPEWNMKEQYFDDVISTAFAADPLRSTHPISVHVSTPEEVDQIFDSISYDKGGTVLHMIETYVGAANFRKGLHVYLRDHAYGNAEKQDLWGAIDKAIGRKSRITASEFASRWVNQPGYPIVEVSAVNSRLAARQRRFLIVDYKLSKEERWPIPIPYISERGKKGEVMLSKGSASIPAKESGWIKLNYGQNYLYRVRYPDSMLRKIGSGIKAKKIRGPDAWGIENDLFALARSGKVPAEEYLSFVESYLTDPDHPVSFSISSHLGWLRAMLDGTDAVKRVKEVGVRYHLGILKRLGWSKSKGEKSLDTMLRGMAVLSLGQMDHKPTISRALALFSKYLKTRELDPDLKGAVYSIAAWVGGPQTYSKMVALYKKEEMPDDKRRFLQSLALFRDPKLIRSTLKFAFSKDVRLQDSYVLPAIISSNPVGKKMIWGWTRQNWRFLMKTYDSGTHMLERFVTNLGGISSVVERRQIAAFYKKSRNRRGDINLRVAQSLEKIGANINFMKANSE